MIVTNDEGLSPYIASLDRLYGECFDGFRFNESDPAELRALVSSGTEVVSHAAIKRYRYDFITDPQAATWILGYVCTGGAWRGSGHASRCLEELFGAIQSRAWIMVLNCKQSLAGFYEKWGFETIAERASYDRNGGVVVDDDPVMAKCSTPELRTAIARNAVLHLGEEF